MMGLVLTNDYCWNRIGVAGDRSCPELAVHVHCRNCPVHADAARTFFDRLAPEGYREEWTAILARDVQKPDCDFVSVLIFRVGDEWLAFSTPFLVEVAHPRPYHRVPHRSNAMFLGLVNIRGQLQLLFSLHATLGIEITSPANSHKEKLLVVVEQDKDRWVFLADEIRGIERIPRTQLCKVPGTLANPVSSFTQAVFTWQDRTVGFLDEQRVLTAFRSLGQ